MPDPSANRSRYLLELRKRFQDAMQGQNFHEVADLCGMVKALFDRPDNVVGGGDPLPEQADLFDTVADLLSLADQPTAERLYERSLQIRRGFFGDKHRMVALSLDHLSAFYSGIGRADDAQKFAERARTLYESCLKDFEATVPAIVAKAEYGTARPMLEDACRIAARLHGAQSIEHARWVNNLAYLYKQVAQNFNPEYFPPAERCYRASLDLFRRVYGEEHPELAAPLNNLGQLCLATGKLDEAKKLLEHALKITEQAAGSETLFAAAVLNNLSNLANEKGELSEAERLHLKALEIRRQTVGESHGLFAQSLNNLAMTYKAQGRFLEAEPLLLRAIQILTSFFGEHHLDTVRAVSNLAEIYNAMGNQEAADKLMAKTVETLQKHAASNLRSAGPLAGP